MRLLMIDDDEAFARVMLRRLEHHGWPSVHCLTPSVAMEEYGQENFEVILLDLNLQGESGLKHLEALARRWPKARIIILTGYASIATTVHAIKNGAADYLTKPIEITQLLKAISGEEEEPEFSEEPVGVDTLEWEMIQRTLQEHDGNISATARALKMHRRTLQRRLQKRRS
ncbi:two-component system response regulator [Aliidiomarina iranensis]|uniref:Two-component system response regulator n=1 Tax=Aliidiomarina iranensis TaxID=1434071 RepID=A0A432W255_9GAMM|nr:response regulator [Aliidiomarina iranensis]RUO23243.1 two-component system response regulator [Aliidiomarina iranensis]